MLTAESYRPQPGISTPDLIRPTGDSYVPQLDGLRAIAIFAVIAFHAGGPMLRGGFIGVDVFFALSGYLITRLLLREHERRGKIHLGHFYARRALRLLPAVVAMLIFFVITQAIAGELRRAARDALFVLFYVYNWAWIAGYNLLMPLGHCWSLSVEEQFYLLWPLILILLLLTLWQPGRLAILALLGALAAAGWRAALAAQGADFVRLHVGIDTHCDGLLLGCALAMSEPHLHLPRWPSWPAWLAAGFLIAIAFTTRHTSPWMLYGGFFGAAVSATLILANLRGHPEARLSQFLRKPVLVRTGKISYGMYLWHYPIEDLVNRGLVAVHSPVKWPIILIVGGGLTYAIAALSFRWVETPFLRLKHRFA